MIKEGTEVTISFLLFLAVAIYVGFAVAKYVGQMNNFSNQTGLINNVNNTPGTTAQTDNSSASVFTIAEVATHNKAADCWLIIANKVYSVSSFLNLHPGGADRIIPYCGQDATQAFATKGGRGNHSSRAQAELATLYLGPVSGSISSSPINTPTAPINTTSRGGGEYEDD